MHRGDNKIADLDNLTLLLTQELIAKRSISPIDDGCQELLATHLRNMGFTVEHLPFGDVSNLWATLEGPNSGPILAFAGHTDVVPPGPIDEWHSDPFNPIIKDGMLFGRGAADMKGSLAAMITGIKRFLNKNTNYKGTIALLITSDEEASAVNGTAKVLEELKSRKTQIDWCIVGEPSSSESLGDVIRVGRRGSLSGDLRIIGRQGHVAYPKDAINPIHLAMPALHKLSSEQWDEGNEFFPATTMQLSNIHAGSGVNNVIPSALDVMFNFRYSPEVTAEELKTRTIEILKKHSLNFDIKWHLSGRPFITHGGELVSATKASIREVLNIKTELSTSGGTSDGRFIAPTGAQVVELGPSNKTIHKVNECVNTNDLLHLSRLYANILGRMLTSP